MMAHPGWISRCLPSSKNNLGIGRRHGLIRTFVVTDAARHDGAQLPALISNANTASNVWADTA